VLRSQNDRTGAGAVVGVVHLDETADSCYPRTVAGHADHAGSSHALQAEVTLVGARLGGHDHAQRGREVQRERAGFLGNSGGLIDGEAVVGGCGGIRLVAVLADVKHCSTHCCQHCRNADFAQTHLFASVLFERLNGVSVTYADAIAKHTLLQWRRMETESSSYEQLPQEVSMYLDWFDQVTPDTVVEAHQELYRGHLMEDPIRSKLYNHLRHAMALYPSRAYYTNSGGAAELYECFAQSQDSNDTLSMLSILVNLWNSDPQAATRVTKRCLTRRVQESTDEIVLSVATDIARRAITDGLWTDDDADSLGYLTVERLRRASPTDDVPGS